MTEEQKEILKQANIPITWWEYCNIVDGVIHIPSMEVLHENNLVSEEEYEYWLSQKEQIDICDEKPSPEEQLMDMAKMILDLQYQIDVLTLLNQEG